MKGGEIMRYKLGLIVLFCILFVYAGERQYLGIKVMLGGRFDNLRMCVASPPGAKGGPIADIMLLYKVNVSDEVAMGVAVPVMRPILFGLAFRMLQFEPEYIVEIKSKLTSDVNLVWGPGLGISLHYGPDYKSSKGDNDRRDFFAAGPFVSGLVGVQFQNRTQLNRVIGVRAFYAPLFSREYSTGTVAGAALEGQFDISR